MGNRNNSSIIIVIALVEPRVMIEFLVGIIAIVCRSLFDKIKSTITRKNCTGIIFVRYWLNVTLKRTYAKIRKYETKYALFSLLILFFFL